MINNLNLLITSLTAFSSAQAEPLTVSPTFIIPAEFLDDDAVVVTAPFTLTGFGAGPVLGVQTIELVGQGTVTLLLTRQTVG